MVNELHRVPRRHRALAVGLAGLGVAMLPFLIPGVVAPKSVAAAPSIQTSFPVFGDAASPLYDEGPATAIVSGPGGNLWMDLMRSSIVKLAPSGTASQCVTSAFDSTNWGYSYGNGIAVGPDGNLWVTLERTYTANSINAIKQGVIARVTPACVVTYFPTPTSGSFPYEIASGPNGALWFTENSADKIGSVTISGAMAEYAIPTPSSAPMGIVAAPDGNLWFTESGADKIGRMTPTGSFAEFAVATGAQPHDIAVGPDGNLWFAEYGTNGIGTMTTSGSGYKEFAVPTASSGPDHIISGPGAALWFTEYAANQIGQATTAGTITEYPVQASRLNGIASGPDGNIWYTSLDLSTPERSPIGRLPLAPCGDLTSSVISANDGTLQRDTPGSQERMTITLANCGAPTLTSATTSTSVTPPNGCGPAPAIPSFTSTLTYGQTTTSTATFTAPSCRGTYKLVSTTTAGSSSLATFTTYYVVSNGGGSHIVGDFNGDGYQDVAVSDVSTGGADTGQVLVYYGGPTGLDTTSPQLFTPLTAGMPAQLTSVGQTGLGFGFSLVAGDYNGDRYSDLAIGVPGYGYTTTGYQTGKDGAVVVLKGGPAGLTTSGNQLIPAPSGLCQQCGVGLNPEAGTAFGWSMASGDFMHNGYADLAVDAPFATIGSAQRAGAVTVMYGSPSGLGATQTVLTESTAGMPGPAIASHDGFGWSLAVGDFKRNGFADLAIAAPGKAGDIVLYGSSSGLTTTGAQYLQGVGPYAYQLAAGDFNGNGYSDLAVGESCANMVEIHYGGKSGLGSVAFKTAQEITPKSAGMPPEAGTAYFGEALAAGDIKHNGRADLVISGAPAGNIVVWGTSTKLTTRSPQVINDMPQILGLADVNGDGYADLLDGDPFHDAPNPQPKINVYGGSTTGLAGTPAYSLTQQTPGALSLTGHTAGQDGFCGQP